MGLFSCTGKLGLFPGEIVQNADAVRARCRLRPPIETTHVPETCSRQQICTRGILIAVAAEAAYCCGARTSGLCTVRDLWDYLCRGRTAQCGACGAEAARYSFRTPNWVATPSDIPWDGMPKHRIGSILVHSVSPTDIAMEGGGHEKYLLILAPARSANE